MLMLGIFLTIIALLLSVSSGMGKAFYDLCNHGKYSKSIFTTWKNQNYLDPVLSNDNKYEEDRPAWQRTIGVLFTDAWHLSQFLMTKGDAISDVALIFGVGCVGLSLNTPSLIIVITTGTMAIVTTVISALTFHLCYRKYFFKKEHQRVLL